MQRCPAQPDIDAQTFSASVHARDRALRAPREPFRPLVFESLLGLEGVEAKLSASGESWRVPLLDRAGYNAAIQRVHHSPYGGDLSFAVPRLSLLRALVAVARDVAKLHARGLVHGDLAPGNVLLAADGPISFDSLDVKAGSPATAAVAPSPSTRSISSSRVRTPVAVMRSISSPQKWIRNPSSA